MVVFGAGMGIMMLAILGMTSGGSYHHLNALKNLLSVVIAIIAITIFVSGGVVSRWAALIMFPAAALGGYVECTRQGGCRSGSSAGWSLPSGWC